MAVVHVEVKSNSYACIHEVHSECRIPGDRGLPDKGIMSILVHEEAYVNRKS